MLPRIQRSGTPPRPPETCLFFLLLSTTLSFAQTILPLPSLSTFNLSLTASAPLVLSLNSSSSPSTVYLSVSLCTESNLLPTILVTNATSIKIPSSSDLLKKGTASNPKLGVWILDFDAGFASWNGTVGEGGLRVASYSSQDRLEGEIEVGLSTTAPLQTISPTLPVLADTSSTHLLLFTPVFSPPPASAVPQTYPNYVLPPPPPLSSSNPVNASLPTLPPNHSFYIFPSSPTLLNSSVSLGKSSCFVRKQTGRLKNVTVVEKQTRLLAGKGWREMVVLEGQELVPEEEYIVWVEKRVVGGSGVELSGPIAFRMKEADFPCPLLYTSPTSICPSLTYAAALPESETSAGLLTSLPSNLTSIIETYLASFATTLSTYACGRDNYSPVSSCEMCYEVYREWLCRSLVPRSCILFSCCRCSSLD
ncbi:stretch-activated cation channel Mid1 [Mrakia frigida]|uniref:Mid1p n=1 Tax=Mrakia frigida TaxID=29902 RepID=UPI003FCC0BEB